MPGKDGSTVSGGGSGPLLRVQEAEEGEAGAQRGSSLRPLGDRILHAKALSLAGAASARGVADVRRVAFWVIKTRFPAALP